MSSLEQLRDRLEVVMREAGFTTVPIIVEGKKFLDKAVQVTSDDYEFLENALNWTIDCFQPNGLFEFD